MNFSDLMPYLGGPIPENAAAPNLNTDPRAILMGGIVPGLLNMSHGGHESLSSPAPASQPSGAQGGMIPGLLSRTANTPLDTLDQNSRHAMLMAFLRNEGMNAIGANAQELI